MTDRWVALDAIGSFGALVFSVLTALVAVIGWIRTRSQLNEEREQVARERRRAQASRVVGWIETRSVEESWSLPSSKERTRTLRRAHVVIRNGSDLPVFDVEVTVDEVERKPVGSLQLVPPESEREVRLHPSDYRMGDPITMSFTFRDAQERAWARGRDGRLIERDVHGQVTRAHPVS